MKLSHIRDIAAVAERGSLHAAARQLGIAQPAISRSIRQLEHELGVTLFERSARGVTLTPAGELFLRRARAAQNELRQAREEIAQMKGETSGQVSVALSTVSHIALLPRVIEPFRQRYGDIFMRITEGLFPTLESTLLDGDLDFYVGPLAETPSKKFLVEKLFDNTRVVFGRKGHALSGARSLVDLVDAQWITTTVTSVSEAELYPLFERHGLPRPKVAMQAPSALSMIVAAGNSDLLMMLPEQWLGSRLAEEMLEPLQLEEILPAAPICIVRRARLPLTPAAEYLADLLRRSAEHHCAAREAGRSKGITFSRG
jgi:LysR family transcriptional regulator of abg operon